MSDPRQPGQIDLPPAYPDRAAWGTAPSLRAWQTAALAAYAETSPRDFLAVATPGAGKTTFALSLASDLLSRRLVERVTVVAPTEHLKHQWAQAADRVGIPLDPDFSTRRRSSKDFLGVALTYAGVAANPLAHRVRTERFRTLVILDEVHHAGDALSWGEAVREAFEPARRRLALTGTPFRSDINPIPFVTYAPGDDGVPRSVADYTYGYAHALADHVVRPVLFMAYSGQVEWRTRAGDEVAARLGEPLTKDMTAQALRTALDPHGAWIPAVLQAADRRLTEVRRHVPDAGGLVIATDQEHARAYAARLAEVAGEKPTLVLSDEPSSSKRIQKFAEDGSRWMVAVRMVSEGVDVPRLAVGVYATTTATPLFFAQAVGRFVRARARGETASIFVPSVPALLEHAGQLELERDHVLGRPVRDADDLFAAEDDLLAREQQSEAASDDLQQLPFEAIGSSATFDRVLYDGAEFGHAGEVHVGSEEEMDFLGIPGLLDADQVRDLLHLRQRERASHRKAEVPRQHDEPREQVTHEQLATMRRELNGLVAAWYHRTGQPHGVTHATLRKECGGPPAAAASADQLRARIERLRDWARRG
ncbi:DEAD/DEAH box helicase [Nocardioides aequoreus]|uniref:DEAD/DEAH box helicase n=1 Tax=Nocardioides aequoreus TaxID=397278 RepID=UPI0004C4278C